MLALNSIVVVTLGWMLWRTATGGAAEQVQTETFTLLALCEWFNVLNCRSATRSAFSMRLFANPWLLVIALGVIVALLIGWRVVARRRKKR